ncbi:hypothetical protein FSP39_024154 [Pinctada imbricata]|uniref:Potassium channel tetramerisation-type BTB domain-containing protein n=1 Tax=Pinctada imbricata TaxID=66713 RepID=A0AA89C2I4_PINIB|nr:hypothetical protein FSP39_024154 [Pinctada imbricata]
MTKYICVVCEDDDDSGSQIQFERRSLCERHILEKHSGFGYRCTSCSKFFNRPDNHKGKCLDGELKHAKRITGTMTEEEEKEYDNFIARINANVRRIETRVGNPTQGKQQQKENRKRSHTRNKSYDGKRGAVLQDLYQTNRNTYKSKRDWKRKDDSRGRNVDRRIVEEAESSRTWTETNPDKETSHEVTSTKVKETEQLATSKVTEDVTSNKASSSKVGAETSTVTQGERTSEGDATRNDEEEILSIFTEGELSEKAEEELQLAKQMISEDVEERKEENLEVEDNNETSAVRAPESPSHSTHTSASAPSIYVPTPTYQLKLKELSEAQSRRIIINVGGMKFETSAVTLQKDPNSILVKMVQHDSLMKPYQTENIYSFFLDRDPRSFHIILNYLRNNLNINADSLPNDIKHLRDLET